MEHLPPLSPKRSLPFHYSSDCREDLLTDIILLPTVHVEWRQACVESEKRFEFTISHCCQGSLMGGIGGLGRVASSCRLFTTRARPVYVESKKDRL